MEKIAVITARGGSKRIPMKNIKEFCGKPIIAYSIETALKSELFDSVMVSTDSEEIAEIARKYGADVPFFRSAATSDDKASTYDVLVEVIDEYKKRGIAIDYLCCMYPTAPFLTQERLSESFDLLTSHKCLSVYPVTDFSFPPQRAVYVDENNVITWVTPNMERVRSQDLPKMYHDCGQFYFINVSILLNRDGEEGIIDNTSRAIILNSNEAQDIDTPSDWVLAELKYRVLHPEISEK